MVRSSPDHLWGETDSVQITTIQNHQKLFLYQYVTGNAAFASRAALNAGNNFPKRLSLSLFSGNLISW
jgi:hypothetical protein